MQGWPGSALTSCSDTYRHAAAPTLMVSSEEAEAKKVPQPATASRLMALQGEGQGGLLLEHAPILRCSVAKAGTYAEPVNWAAPTHRISLLVLRQVRHQHTPWVPRCHMLAVCRVCASARHASSQGSAHGIPHAAAAGW